MSGPQVLILEDDHSLSAAIVSFLKKKGIESYATSSADDARAQMKNLRFRMVIVDCLLPSENGVDFAQSLRKEHPSTLLDIVLMSGIFTEASFIKESIKSTEAVSFLKKPFELEELAPLVELLSGLEENASPRKMLYQAFGNPTLTDRDKRKIFESLEDMHGFDLPYIYSFLIQSKVSGHLNVVDAQGRVFGITAAAGTIVGVDLADSDTFLGRLLIESGFILPEDLELVLNIKSSKRIGEKLIHSHLLSPHGFESVLANQMSIRLSRTISDQPVKVNFVASDIEPMSPHIDSERLERFIHDWIASKFTDEWLKAHFTAWGNAVPVKGPEFKLNHSAFSYPLVANLERLTDLILNGATLNEIIDRQVFEEPRLLKSILFLISVGVLTMKERPKQRSADDQKKHLKNIHHQLAGKNAVEVYDLMCRISAVSETQPDQVYQEFMVMIGQAPSAAQRDLVSVYNDIKKLAKSAYDTVKSGSHLKLKDELMRGEVEKKLKASQYFEQARAALEKSQFSQALQDLEKTAKLDPKYSKLHLHLAWARIGTLDSVPNKSAGFKMVDNDLMQVDPEDKFDALFSFVTGLYLKAKGDYGSARRAFDKAIAMDSSMIAARREMAVLASLTKPKQDVFNQDLKTLVGSLFQRKK